MKSPVFAAAVWFALTTLVTGCADHSTPLTAATTSDKLVVTSEGSPATTMQSTVTRAADGSLVGTLDWSAADHLWVYAPAIGASTEIHTDSSVSSIESENATAALLAEEAESGNPLLDEASQGTDSASGIHADNMKNCVIIAFPSPGSFWLCSTSGCPSGGYCTCSGSC